MYHLTIIALGQLKWYNNIMNENAPKQTIAEAEAQAYEIENAGREASAKVRKGLFMSAATLTELRQQAYKEGIRSKTLGIKADESWNDLMAPTFDDDGWEAGADPNYR